MLYNYIISVIVYFKFFFNFKLPIIIFYVFISGGNCLPLYYIYLAKVGREGWSLWNFFTKEGMLALI